MTLKIRNIVSTLQSRYSITIMVVLPWLHEKAPKYTQEEMYLAIDLWKESGLSQQRYCLENSIALNTFRYWVKNTIKRKNL